jgi:hypothetical protein
LKDEVDFENKEDGSFFMTFGAYYKKFGYTWINYDTSDWSRTSFLMLDDSTNSPGQPEKCGENCTRHVFTLESDIK